MTVFNSVLISFQRNLRVILIYLFIFIAISFAMLGVLKDKVDEQFERAKPTVLLIEQGVTSEFNDQFKDFLSSIANIDHSISDPLLAHDLIESKRYAMLILLDEQAKVNLSNGAPVLETYYNQSDNSAVLMVAQLNSYFRYLSASQKINGTADYSAVKRAMASHAPVELLNKKSATNKEAVWFSYYMVNLAYVIIVLFTILLILVLREYNEPMVASRRRLAKLSEFKQRLLMGGACSANLVAIALILFLIGLAFIKFNVPLEQIAIHLLNLIAFATTVISFGMLLNTLNIKPNFAHGVANVISLATAFIAGIFIPLEFLPSAVVAFAKFLPAYYYAKTARGIVSGGENIALLMAIQLLFTLCYSVATWYLSQTHLAKARKAL